MSETHYWVSHCGIISKSSDSSLNILPITSLTMEKGKHVSQYNSKGNASTMRWDKTAKKSYPVTNDELNR